MIRSRIFRIVGLALLLVFPLGSANAQEEDPPEDTTFTVTGRIINHNTDDPPPEGLVIMLHAWDSSGQQKAMVHGESNPGGTFTFENVFFDPEIFYAVMVTYEGATYFSKPAQAQSDKTIEPIAVLIYETTNDLSQLKLEMVHMIFEFDQGGLIIGELYGLVNHGDRTLAEGTILADGSNATIAFTLPEGAANVSFPGSPPERYSLIQGGFSLNQPLSPSSDSGMVFVSYVLPFENELTLERELPLETATVNLLIPHEGGMSVDAVSLEYVEPIESAVSIERETMTNTNGDESLLIGIAALGFSLIAVGVWWWRREPEDPEDLDDELIDSMDETES
jgi:hypothetical protein